jgi:hypothetical protein
MLRKEHGFLKNAQNGKIENVAGVQFDWTAVESSNYCVYAPKHAYSHTFHFYSSRWI